MSRIYPQWFIDELVDESVKELARNGELKSTDHAKFKCPDCGAVTRRKIGAYIKLSTGQRRCNRECCTARGGYNGTRWRIPEYIIDQMALDTDKEKARANELVADDEVLWKCERGRHPDYLQRLGNHVKRITGEQKHGCPMCKFQKIKIVPEWYISDLANESDKEEARRGEVYTSDGGGSIEKEYICPVHGVYTQRVSNHINTKTGEKRSGCPMCVQGTVSSKAEGIVAGWLSSYTVERNNRGVVKSPSGHWMELDVYLPDELFAVECDGVVYHNEVDMSYQQWEMKKKVDPDWGRHNKWKGYHQWKDDQCAQKGVKLIHVCSESVIDFPEETKAYITEELDNWRKFLGKEQ